VSKLRVQSFAVSIDGYGAGPGQDLQNPLGVGGPELMEWFFHTRVWRRMHGHDDGETGVDNEMAERGFAGIGAWILGRNMFGPVRGPWPDESWKGWWGEEPPYHTPVFVLTHYPRPPLGKVVSRKVVSRQYSEKLPAAPDGKYVTIRYETVFENKASAVETITPMLDPDGVFRVSGHYIR
jgi:dihydrofolate reductase